MELTEEQIAEVQRRLAHWIALAEIYNTNGLPIDLMYIHCKQKDYLPVMEEDGKIRPCTQAEFERGIKEAVKTVQAGGVEKVMQEYLQRDQKEKKL
jgi:hypothetical protein